MHSTPVARIHSLDALRAIALLLGIVLHGALSFMPGVDMAVWPVQDSQNSLTLALLSYVIHVFRMSLFFLIAGFFARLLLHRRGVHEFIRNRTLRIALPLIAGWIVCAIALALVVTWIMSKQGVTTPDGLPPELRRGALSFFHLWFLYVLLWLYALTLLTRWVSHRWLRHAAISARLDAHLEGLMRSIISPLVLALPIFFALSLVPTGSGIEVGVPTPGYTLIPPLASLIAYGYVFAIGWCIERQRALLQIVERRALVHLGIGSVATVASLASMHSPWMFDALYALALITLTLAAVGLGIRYLSRQSAVMRYLADASYWMYIAHLPLIMALQQSIAGIAWHWSIKFMLVVAGATALLLVSYRYCVRRTWIGHWLNGPRPSQDVRARAN